MCHSPPIVLVLVRMGKEPEYFLEVRIYQARAEGEQAMREGLLSLEDVHKLVEKAKSRRGDQSRLDSR